MIGNLVSLDTVILSLSKSGTILSAENCPGIFGYQEEELVGKKFHQILPSPYSEQYEALIRDCSRYPFFQNILSKHSVIESIHKNQSLVPISITISPLSPSSNSLQDGAAVEQQSRHIEGDVICQSIEGDQARETMPAKQEDDESSLYIAFIDRAEDNSALITIDSKGVVLSCSNIERMFGYSANELARNHVNILLPNYKLGRDQLPSRQEVRLNLSSSLQSLPTQSPQQSPLQSPQQPRQQQPQTQQQQPQRPPSPMMEVKNVMGRHKSGDLFFVSLQLNVLKVKEFELFSCRLSKVDSVLEAVMTVDDMDTIVSSNNFVLTLFGYEASSLIGRKFSDLVPVPRKSQDNNDQTKSINNSTSITDMLGVSSASNYSASTVHSQIVIASTSSTDPTSVKSTVASCPVSSGYYDSSHCGHGSQVSPHTSDGDTSCSDDDTEPSYKKQKRTHFNADSFTSSSSCSSCDLGHKQFPFEIQQPQASPATASPPSSQVQNMDNVSAKDYSRRKQFLHKDGSYVPIRIEAFSFWSSSEKTTPSCVSSKRSLDGDCIVSQANTSRRLYGIRITRVDLSEYWRSKKTVDNYLLLEVIGKGASSKVRRAVHIHSKDQVAVKILQKAGDESMDTKRAMLEIDILMKLDHPNIIKLYKAVDTRDKIYIIMEHVDGTDLMSYIQKSNGLCEAEARRIFIQVASALSFCHTRGVVHRDVKCRNILIDRRGDIKLIDFGMSNWTEQGKLRSTFCGTPAFSAPEIILGRKYEGPQIDVWSMGVVLYCMVTGKFPFSTVSEVIQGDFQDPPNVSADCVAVIRKMLVLEPSKRAAFKDILRHPWISQAVSRTWIQDSSSTEGAMLGSQNSMEEKSVDFMEK